MSNLTDKELDRFNSKYLVDTKGCWIWQDYLDKDGYGTFFLRGVPRRAHRVSYYNAFGAITEGNVVNHVCRNPSCVNPQHLQSVTPTVNNFKDTNSICYINSQKTHCPKGHEYDKTVTYGGKTQRICTICDKEARAKARKERYAKGKVTLAV